MIALATGAKPSNLPDRLQAYFTFPDGEGHCAIDELQYDESWTWLMSVIEFIERNYHLTIQIEGSLCYIFSRGVKDKSQPQLDSFKDIFVEDETKMIATYEAVVKFFTWYNSVSK